MSEPTPKRARTMGQETTRIPSPTASDGTITPPPITASVIAAIAQGTTDGTDGTKQVADFRNFDTCEHEARRERVARFYHDMRSHQTLAFSRRMLQKFGSFDHARMTVREAFDALGSFVDASDPDVDLPQIQHALQTAEGIRAAGKPGWFQLVGLIHDMGKIMFLWGSDADGMSGRADGPQWALGGDTWVVGCAIPDTVVLPELNALNADMSDSRYNTELGQYEEGCGMAELEFAWGHDEYMYRMLAHNIANIARDGGSGCSLPDEALAMVRYHSCYPWHTQGEYARLQAPGDDKLKAAVLEFNSFDLYTKCERQIDVDEVWPHYQALIDRYLPGKLDW